MSALFGLVRLDDGLIAPSLPRVMNAALAHRGSVELIGTAEHAVLGARGPGDGSLAVVTIAAADRPRRIVVAADARLDEREGLAEQLGMRLGESEDAELILKAYLQFGDEVAGRLTGDFAFAIWDERTGKLLLGRDPMGVKPLYIHRGAGMVAFASEIGALLALPTVSRDPDPDQLAVQLAWAEPDRTGTAYRAIRRLPAAHTLTTDADGDRQPVRYWSLDGVGEVLRADPREYAQGLAEVLATAVRERMRRAEVVASALSGGLDSSSITCLARREAAGAGVRELHALSLVFDDLSGDDRRLIDERRYMRAVVDGGGLQWHQIPGDSITPFGGMDELLTAIGQPFAAPNVHLHWQMYRQAASAGATVFLDGVDGDTAVSHGFGRLNGQLARGDWDGFAREVHAFAERDGRGAARILQHYGLPYLEDLAEAGRWRDWARAASALAQRFRLSRAQLLWRRGVAPAARHILGGGARSSESSAGRDLLAPALVEGMERRATSLSVPRATLEREGHRSGVMQPAYQSTLEIADACAARWGVVPRYPFFDRRVLEYCVSLPDAEKLANGWSRLVLRRAMEGILPSEVQWRVGKSNLSPAFAAALRGADHHLVQQADLSPLSAYTRSAVLDRARRRHAAGELSDWGDPDGYLLYRAIVTARWIGLNDMNAAAEAAQGIQGSAGNGSTSRRRAPAA